MDTELISGVAAQTMRWNFRMWSFGEGIALRGLMRAGKALGSSELHGFVNALLRAYVGRGVAKSPEEHIAPGAELLMLYEQTGDTSLLDAALKLARMHASFPANRDGARMHRADLPGWGSQIWVDCMDAEAPFLARLGKITNDENYFNQATDELTAYARLLQDEASGLFHHGYEEACGVNGQVWARGNGWALLGLVETLALLPAQHHAGVELRERLHRLSRGLAVHQHAEGLWHTVITNDETYLESTLAVMTAYAFREAFEHGLLKRDEFGEMEREARAAALKCVADDGTLRLVSDATPVGELKMYATRTFGVFPWGQGPLLLMLSQI